MAQTSSKYQEKKEQRIQQALDTLTIECDVFGTFALVPSTSNRLDVYSVTIDESAQQPYAVRCTCKGNREHGAYCVHMIATDRLFTKTNMHVEVEQEPTYSTSEIEAYADTLMRYAEVQDQQKRDEDAALAEECNMQKLALYREAYLTPHYGCCGHLVKAENDGELCGACLCK